MTSDHHSSFIHINTLYFSGSEGHAVDRKWKVILNKNYTGRRYLNFSVVSYNVLAQNLIEANDHLYTGLEPYYLSWEYRSQNLLKEIKRYSPDVSLDNITFSCIYCIYLYCIWPILATNELFKSHYLGHNVNICITNYALEYYYKGMN